MKWFWLVAGILLMLQGRIDATSFDTDVDGFDDDDNNNNNAFDFQIKDSVASNPFQVEVKIAYDTTNLGTGPFDQVKRFLESRFPEGSLKVTGENYPPTPMAEFAQQVGRMLQVASTIFVIGGAQIAARLGFAENPLFQRVMEKKVLVMFGVMFVIHSANFMAKTDAFEISINGERVFSRIETGRMPTFDELSTALAQHGVVIGDGQYQSLHSRSI